MLTMEQVELLTYQAAFQLIRVQDHNRLLMCCGSQLTDSERRSQADALYQYQLRRRQLQAAQEACGITC